MLPLGLVGCRWNWGLFLTFTFTETLTGETKTGVADREGRLVLCHHRWHQHWEGSPKRLLPLGCDQHSWQPDRGWKWGPSQDLTTKKGRKRDSSGTQFSNPFQVMEYVPPFHFKLKDDGTLVKDQAESASPMLVLVFKQVAWEMFGNKRIFCFSRRVVYGRKKHMPVATNKLLRECLTIGSLLRNTTWK